MSKLAETKVAYAEAEKARKTAWDALVTKQRAERKCLRDEWGARMKAGRLAIRHAEALDAMNGDGAGEPGR